jgi:acetyltransferase-like isoleucine patch superfamily enzyme/dTDP-4-dehydrorhamnose 3,5-epimerase-like enzyme
MGSRGADGFIPNAELCESKSVGAGTRIGVGARIRKGASIGRDCIIGDNVLIENEVEVGDRVTIEPEAQLHGGLAVESDVRVGACAKLAVDRDLRSREAAKTIIKRAASIGAGATIVSGVLVGEGAVIGAQSTITAPVPPGAVVAGDPARILGYRDSERQPISAMQAARGLQIGASAALPVRGCHLRRIASIADPRGRLTVTELGDDLPFAAKRIFFVHDVPEGHVRGGHSHRSCAQFLLAIQGNVSALIDDRQTRDEVVLDDPGSGLLVPPGIWSLQYRFSDRAVLVVFASRPYEAADYVRDYDEFLSAT